MPIDNPLLAATSLPRFSAIRPEQVMGRVWYHVPYIGFLTNGRNALLVIGALGAALVGYAIYTLVKNDDDDASLAGDEIPGRVAAGATHRNDGTAKIADQVRNDNDFEGADNE